MKLGEALTLRATQAQHMAELTQRVSANATTQEGDEPAQDPQKLLDELEALSESHRDLVLKINRTNVDSGLLELLVEREHLRRTRNYLNGASKAATSTGPLYMRHLRSEIKTVPHLDIAVLAKRIDELGEQARVLDAQIQERNWRTDLIS